VKACWNEPTLGLVCDTDQLDRLYGTAWDDRVATWRAALAVEAGSGIVDHDGSIKARTEAYLEAHPGAEFEKVRRDVLGNDDGNVDFKVISSRVLEAIALRTALVMFPGRYSDVVRPDVHYLVLERDFSNLDKVAAALRDARSLEAMTERAYRDVVATGRYSYRAFAETIDAVLERHAPKGWVPNRPSPRQVLARAERFARRAAAIAGDRAIRGVVAASAVTRDPDRRLPVWRYISAGPARPAVAPRRLLADILKLHLLRRAQVGGAEVSIPFKVNAEFQPGGEVMFRTRPTGPTGEVPTDISDLDLSSIEAAIRDGYLRNLSWDYSTVSGRGRRIGNRRTLHLGGAGGFNSLDALAVVANRFPSETAAALVPLFTSRRGPGEQAEPVSPMWANLSAWAVENAACLDRLGFVRAFEQADRKRPKRWRSEEPTPAAPRAISREQETLRLEEVHALELDIPSRRDAPHAVIKHDRINQTHAGARYEIEVITWDAYPGMPVPALVYRPLDDQPIARPCVIVALASQTSVATHGELYSAQRHAANLALRGFVVFVFASGLCFNGLNGERLENSYAFDTYGRLSGSGFTSRSIDIQMYLRAFDYMAGRADVDPDRIAASGYSYGGRMAYYLAVFEPRVAALGIAAAAVITEGHDPDTVYSARRDAAMTSRVPDWFTNGEPERIHQSAGPFTDALGDTLLLAPRPFRLVLGNQDPGTSISMASTRIERLVDVYRALDSRAMPPDLMLDAIPPLRRIAPSRHRGLAGCRPSR
jgi:dienelactone hydrolase